MRRMSTAGKPACQSALFSFESVSFESVFIPHLFMLYCSRHLASSPGCK
jgi:hypothetical protein